jgi:hypothetical protein
MFKRNGANGRSGAENSPPSPPAESPTSFGQVFDIDKHIGPVHLSQTSEYQASKRSALPNNMPILHDFALPKAIGDLKFPPATKDAFFLVFLASKDPQTNKAWCPDVVAAMPALEATFSGDDKPQAAFIEVGQRPEYDRRHFHREYH